MAEESRIEVRFGEPFEGDGHLNFKVNLVINSEQAHEKLEEAKKETANQFELNYSLLLTFQNSENSNINELNNLFNQIKNDDFQHDGNDEKGQKLSNQLLYKKLRKLLKDLDIQNRIIGNNLYVQITLKEQVAEKVLEPFQILLESGLKDLALKTNKLEGEVALGISSEQIWNMLKNDRILVPFLTQTRAKINLFLDKDLSQSLEEVIKNIDESLLTSPQVQFLKYFKSFDINLSFNSAENLPEPIRQYVLPGKIQKSEDNANKKAEEKKQIEQQTLLSGFLKHIPANVTARVFIDEFAYLSVSVSASGFLKVLEDYLTDVIKVFV